MYNKTDNMLCVNDKNAFFMAKLILFKMNVIEFWQIIKVVFFSILFSILLLPCDCRCSCLRGVGRVRARGLMPLLTAPPHLGQLSILYLNLI